MRGDDFVRLQQKLEELEAHADQIRARNADLFPSESRVAELEARVADLERRQIEALASVRMASDMLVAIDTNRGVAASVPLLRAHVDRALGRLSKQDAPPLKAEGVHPKIVARLRALTPDDAA